MINSLQATTIARAATEAGHALKVAWDRKEEKARDYCAREGIIFIPLPEEALVGWHETFGSIGFRAGSRMIGIGIGRITRNHVSGC